MAVTMSLTIIAGAMKKQKVLCKSLSTVETLGSINVLFSDKTGTLTENSMKVTNSAVLAEEKTPEEAQRLATSGDSASKYNPWTQLWHVAGLCCSAKFDAETINRPLADRRILGDATDQATLRFAETLGPVNSLLSAWKQVMDVPFNSKNKVFFFCNLTHFKFMLRIFEVKDTETAEKALTGDEMSGLSPGDSMFCYRRF
jgi:sodium/potassium-transporting ATPase subunit alpha